MAERPAASRRKYLRIPTDQVISFAELGQADQLAVSRDVSAGGIRFEAIGCEINLGDRLRITFNVGTRTLVATGRVVWAVDSDPITQEIGIAFEEIDPAALRWLEEAVEPALESPGPY